MSKALRVLITGAARGIGRAIALRFAREGANVAVADLNLEGVRAVAAEIEAAGQKAVAIQIDVRSLPEIRSTFAFLLFGGGGASVFVDDRAAVYAGYRFQHVSNGNTSRPNRGFESHVGVMGFSFLF